MAEPAGGSGGELEAALRKRFVVREEGFHHGDLFLDLIMPQAADELLDEAEFERDERLPYWADLWPSARAMAQWLLDHPPVGTAIELGCGVGLPSLAMKVRGIDALATDYYADALLFTRANALRNGIDEPRTMLLDWRDIPDEFARFDYVMATDVLYEQRNINLMSHVLRRLVSDAGRAILADPGRAHLESFCEHMDSEGWRRRHLATIDASQPHVERVSHVQLIEFTPGKPAGRRET